MTRRSRYASISKLGRWLIAQGRVKATSIVDFIEEFGNCLAGMDEIAVRPAVDLLLFERFYEAFRRGVIVGSSRPAHAGLDAMALEFGDIVVAVKELVPSPYKILVFVADPPHREGAADCPFVLAKPQCAQETQLTVVRPLSCTPTCRRRCCISCTCRCAPG
jgi:hypothetical protein